MHRSFVLLLFVIGRTDCLFIEGCPLFGCRPSGTFSMYLNVPRKNASIAWETAFVYDPVPRALGCVANDVNIICQSNGPFSEDKGYVSLYGSNGTIQWRDKVLKFPTLPIMDNYGDVTGSDGIHLVHYDADGKLYPIIPCVGMKPIFSLALVGTHFLLMVSENGGFSVRETNAIPDAFMFLNATIDDVNGTFVPVSQPAVNGDRFYILTEFLPDGASKTEKIRRLYAIDVHQRMVKIITVAWYYSFEQSELDRSQEDKPDTAKAKEHFDTLLFTFENKEKRGLKMIPDTKLIMNQILMWDELNNMVYVSLPSMNKKKHSNSHSAYMLMAFKELGNTTSLAYRIDLPVIHMAKFEQNTDVNGKRGNNNITSPLWLFLNDGRITSVSKNGNLINSISLAAELEADVTITSKVILARADDRSVDTLVMGIKLSNKSSKCFAKLKGYGIDGTNVTSLVIAVDTASESYASNILWMVPVPGNLEVKGQLSGSMGAETGRKDQIIFYAEEPGKSAKVMAIQ